MEFVFVVPRQALFPEFYPHGLVRLREVDPQGPASIAPARFEDVVARAGFFVERAHAERTPEWKQLIPYSIVLCDGGVLLTRRLRAGGESRLHDKHSIGIGGHINPEDLEPGARNPIEAGTRREIAEELSVRGSYKVRRVGLLNDDSNAVGAVHVGVVQIVRVEGSVEIRERNQLEGRLVAVEDLRELLARGADFETWSSLLIAHLDEILVESPRDPLLEGHAASRDILPKPLVASS